MSGWKIFHRKNGVDLYLLYIKTKIYFQSKPKTSSTLNVSQINPEWISNQS
jgi:hypothetical protein